MLWIVGPYVKDSSHRRAGPAYFDEAESDPENMDVHFCLEWSCPTE
jgi:hypothetical protein